MLTQREFRLPEVPASSDPRVLREHAVEMRRKLMEILRSLNDPNTLQIGKAQIYVDQGLQFPATQVASSDANNLDDYEEATYTPTITSGSGTLTTVSSISGGYTKIGREYLIDVKFTVTTNGTGAISLKFTLPATASQSGVFYGIDASNGKALIGNVTSGSNTVSVVYYDATYPGVSGHIYEIAGRFI